MSRLLKSELTIILSMALLAILASIFPTFYKAIKAPSGTIYALEHNNLNDYYYYLSLMRQGYEGKWLLTSRTTPEPFPPMFAQTFLAALGRLGHLFAGDMALTYTVSRVSLGFILLILIYVLAKQVLRQKLSTIIACFFAFFGTGFWYIRNGLLDDYLGFWTEFDPFWRTTFLPHHLAGTIFVIASILSIRDRFTKVGFFGFIVFGILAGLSNPASLLNYSLTLNLAILLTAIKGQFHKQKPTKPIKAGLDKAETYSKNHSSAGSNQKPFGVWLKRKKLPPSFFILLSGLIAFGITLLYFAWLERSAFPWNTYRDLSASLHYPLSFADYFRGMGPAAIFTILSIPQFLKSKTSPLKLVIFSWATVPFFSVFVLPTLFSLPNSHFFQAAHFIPLSILAAQGIKNLKTVTFRLSDRYINLSQSRLFSLLLTVVISLLAFYFSISWQQKINAAINQYPGFPFNIYVPKELLSAFDFLNNHTREEEVVLSGTYIGGLLPAFTHNRSVWGHPVNTYKAAEKSNEVVRFYAQDDKEFGKKLTKKYQIKYIIFRLDAPAADPKLVQQLKLRLVYNNSLLSIYQTSR